MCKLKVRALSFSYGLGKEKILKEVNFTAGAGEVFVVLGPSGSGKTTLLQLLGLLERMQEGEIILKNHPFSRLSNKERTLLRRENIGFVYQFHGLLRDFTALENVALPLRLQGYHKKLAQEKAYEALKKIGLKEKASQYPAELSGGEAMRIAVSRAVIKTPTLLLADEPTGNLDSIAATALIEYLCQLVHKTSLIAIVATHDRRWLNYHQGALTLGGTSP